MNLSMSYMENGEEYVPEPEKNRGSCTGCTFDGEDGCVASEEFHRITDCLNTKTIWVKKETKTSEQNPQSTEPVDMILPTDAAERKAIPIVSGFLDYFPLAVAEVAKCSLKANEQHNPGEPLYWNRNKSTDHIECIGRHLIDRNSFDTDGVRHATKLAWRAMANLQIILEKEKG